MDVAETSSDAFKDNRSSTFEHQPEENQRCIFDLQIWNPTEPLILGLVGGGRQRRRGAQKGRKILISFNFLCAASWKLHSFVIRAVMQLQM